MPMVYMKAKDVADGGFNRTSTSTPETIVDHKFNPFKKVGLRTTTSRDADTRTDWRGNYKRILTEQLIGTSNYNAELFMWNKPGLGNLGEALSDTVVDPRVYLLLESDAPGVNLNSGATEQPYKKILQAVDTFSNELVDSFIDGRFSTSNNKKTVGNLIKNLKGNSFIETVVNSISAGGNLFVDKGEQSRLKTAGGWAPWWANTPAWDGTVQSKDLEFTFRFRLGQYGLWNAREEVYKPIINLQAPYMVRNTGYFLSSGPVPNSADLIIRQLSRGLLDTLGELTGILEENSDLNVFEKIFMQSLNYAYDVTIGEGDDGLVQTAYRGMFPVKVSSSFSSDTDNEGYPIYGECRITMKSIIPVTLHATHENYVGLRYNLK